MKLSDDVQMRKTVYKLNNHGVVNLSQESCQRQFFVKCKSGARNTNILCCIDLLQNGVGSSSSSIRPNHHLHGFYRKSVTEMALKQIHAREVYF